MTCDIGASTPEWEMETQKYIRSDGTEPADLLIVALASMCEMETQKYVGSDAKEFADFLIGALAPEWEMETH